ncbi:hypothetical protein [Asaia sp. As-1742]|uniref:hypothetical protein n=1 Tax=Asaia sp. As-1742 TaxID=2608325 RepID=UPI0014246E5C|nr:hypothetical protein [Asaia sp. As-1742]
MFAIAFLASHSVQPRFMARAAINATGASLRARFDTQMGQLLSVVPRLTGGRQD